DAGTEVHDRHDVVKGFLPGEIERQVDVVEVNRDIVRAELSTRTRLRRIDGDALAVDVRPARHHERRTADVNLIPQSRHSSSLWRDVDWISAGAVMRTEERQLLGVLEVAIRTVFRKMPHLRLRGRRKTHERKSAQKILH